ncbi:unnamed protein product, partial [marine sediment metagenome]
AAHLLGIASFDPNGFVRQTALQEMAHLDTEVILPYVLLRWHDWVPQVCQQAQILLENLLKSRTVSLQQLTWCRLLLEKLADPSLRVNLKPIQELLFNYIQQFELQEVMHVFKQAHDWQDKRFLLKVFADCLQNNQTFLESLLEDRSSEIRWWVLKEDIFSAAREKKKTATFLKTSNSYYKSIIEQLAHDKNARVRFYALWHIEVFVPKSEQQHYLFLFVEALIDENYKVRQQARSVLTDQDQHLAYLLAKPTPVTPGLLKAFGELGIADARVFIHNYLTDERPALRAAALYAAGCLALSIDQELVQGLKDPSAKVRKMAVAILADYKYLYLKKEIEQLLNAESESFETKAVALKVLITMSRFIFRKFFF